jgi:hypothetical protein
MMDKTPHANKSPAPKHVENSTDATRGEPLAMRAQKRMIELEAALAKLPAESRARSDIELVLTSIGSLLTGDLEHLADTTASALNHALENSKHLAESAVGRRPR